jgi:hypothetical protein
MGLIHRVVLQQRIRMRMRVRLASGTLTLPQQQGVAMMQWPPKLGAGGSHRHQGRGRRVKREEMMTMRTRMMGTTTVTSAPGT